MKRSALIASMLVATSIFSFSQAPAPPTKTIYLSATKKGKPAVLGPEQLEIPGTIKLKSLKSVGRPGLSYVVALDMSNSARDRFTVQLNLARQVLAQVIRPQLDSGLVVGFDNQATGTAVTQDPSVLLHAMDAFRPGGASAVYDSLKAAAEMLVREAPDQPRIVVLISDGDDNVSRATLSETVAALVSSKVRVFPLYLNPMSPNSPMTPGQTTARGERVLRYIAEQTGGEFLEVEQGLKFDEILGRLNTTLGATYSVEFEFPADATPGIYALGVRSRDKKVNLRIAASYVIEK